MSERVYVATRKGLFTVERGGRSSDAPWRIAHVSFLGENCTMMLPDPRDGLLYVAIGHGHFGVKLHRSSDGGERWEEIAAPAYPEADPHEAPWTDPMGRVVPSSLEAVWSIEAAGAQAPEALWCGTIPGGLFRSDDAGDSWELVRGLWDHPGRRRWFGGGADYPGIHSVCVHPSDPARVRVAVSCGGVWETRDGGEHWDCRGEGWRAEYFPPEQASDPGIQDVHRLASCPAAPDHLWAQHHNGIFRSTDGGEHWDEIEGVEPAAFGFTVAVHPQDPLTAWFVPAQKDEQRIPVDGRVVVTRTRDGGERFEILDRGLPREHAYDLVFRHALDVDDSGETLAFGSTTGSLWLSDDGGARWHCASTHLPPVYAVRFERSA